MKPRFIAIMSRCFKKYYGAQRFFEKKSFVGNAYHRVLEGYRDKMNRFYIAAHYTAMFFKVTAVI